MDQFLIKGNFSFTFTIPAGKNVYHKNVWTPYKMLKHDAQYELLEKVMHTINYHKDIKWVYEEHPTPPNCLHIHGFVMNSNVDEMEDFRRSFYQDYRIKCGHNMMMKMSNIQITQVDIKYFINYMNKHQDTIKYYMSVDASKKHSNDLDGKPTKFNLKIEGKYQHFLGEIQERETTPEYPFPLKYEEVKNRDKFIVQL